MRANVYTDDAFECCCFVVVVVVVGFVYFVSDMDARVVRDSHQEKRRRGWREDVILERRREDEDEEELEVTKKIDRAATLWRLGRDLRLRMAKIVKERGKSISLVKKNRYRKKGDRLESFARKLAYYNKR